MCPPNERPQGEKRTLEKAPRASWRETARVWLAGHAVATFAVVALLFFVCLALLFWYLVFSGLSSSAEFIYSNF